MSSTAIFLIGLLLLGFLIPRRKENQISKRSKNALFFFLVFVLVLAASPLLGGIFVAAIGYDVTLIHALYFTWIGIASSLPFSLFVSRLCGQVAYDDYWNYLTNFGVNSRRKILYFWAFVSSAAFIFGMAFFILGR
jgi:hypothetical protein